MVGRIKRAITAPLRARKRKQRQKRDSERRQEQAQASAAVEAAVDQRAQRAKEMLNNPAFRASQQEARERYLRSIGEESAPPIEAPKDDQEGEPQESGPSKVKDTLKDANVKPNSKRLQYEMHAKRLGAASRGAEEVHRGTAAPSAPLPIIPGAQSTVGTRARAQREETRREKQARLADQARERRQQQQTIQQATAAGVQAGLAQARARVPAVKRQAPPLLRPQAPAPRPPMLTAGGASRGGSIVPGGRGQPGLSRDKLIFNRIQAMRQYGPSGSYWMPGARRAAGWDIRSENLTEAQEGEIRANIASILSVPGGQLPEGNKRALADRAAEGADVNARPGAQGEWVLWIDGQQFAARQYAQEQPA